MTRGVALALALAATSASADSPGGLRYHRIGPDGAALHAAPEGPVAGRAEAGALLEGAPVFDGWLRVALGERVLWLRASDGAPEAPPTQIDGALPDGLLCAGSEPFWSLTVTADAIGYSQLGDDPVAVTLLSATSPAPGFAVVRFAGAQAGRADIQRRDCSDGMSDRIDPWSVVLALELGDAPPGLRGCCRFAARTP